MRFVRRALLATLILGVFALPADAAAQVTLGLSAGAAFTRFSGDAFDTTEVTTGLRQGASLVIPLGQFFSIAPGVFNVQKGATRQLNGVEVMVDMDATIDLEYVEVPLLAVFNVTGADRPVGVSLFVGPSVAFEVSCRWVVQDEYEALDRFSSCDNDLFVDDEVKEAVREREKVDFGATFGAGLSFPLSGPVDFTVNGGLDLGLRSISNPAASGFLLMDPEEEEGPDYNAVFKNSAWFVTAGVSFPLGG